MIGRRKKIIQFGMIRSGSTLIYNILKELFPHYKIIKTHRYQENWKDTFFKIPIVCTYRDPLDIICSSIKRYDQLPSNEVIENHIDILKAYGFKDFINLDKKYKNKLNLKYENFYNNFNYIFDELEEFLNIQIANNLRLEIENKLSVKKVKEKIKKFKAFNEYDKDTRLHGKHISDNDGMIKSHLDFFSEDQINYLKLIYNDFRKEYKFDE